jgi:hypothetical protein
VPLEHGGSIESRGSHFESIVFGNEIMVPDFVLDARFSEFSLAVAADSGWFDIDFTMADEYSFGKDKGCGILEQKCENTLLSEFCNIRRQRSCSDDLTYVNICKNSIFTGNCNVNLPERACKRNKKSTLPFFKYGRNSICHNCEVVIIFYFIYEFFNFH